MLRGQGQRRGEHDGSVRAEMLSHVDGICQCRPWNVSSPCTFSSQSSRAWGRYAAPAMHCVPETFKHMWVQRGSRPGVCRANGARRPVLAPSSPPAARTRSFSHLSPGGETPVVGRRGPLWERSCCKGKVPVHISHSSPSPTLKGGKQTLISVRMVRSNLEACGRPTARAFGASLRGIMPFARDDEVINCRH